jgi:hypothetical protein
VIHHKEPPDALIFIFKAWSLIAKDWIACYQADQKYDYLEK